MTISTEGPRGLFGELYLRSSRPFLPEHVSVAEGDYLAARFAEGQATGLLLDLGCGHGRHLGQLAGRLPGRVVGVDLDPLSVAEARAVAPVTRADLFRLPFRRDAFGGSLCWYNTLGMFEDEAVPVALAELARCVRSGGWVIVHGTPPHAAQRQPEANYDGQLPDGSHLVEQVRFEEARRRDQLTRHLTLPDGRFMAASFFIRYYAVSEWEALFDAAGFEVRWVHGGVDGSPLGDASVDQIVGAQKRG
ncbi:MAG: class I SAM-dependent methyltransferase [Myxococcaceae bacterium]|nr:class I SAM-dependent methyltransferase [Myxococcaceae bacterium]